MTISDLFKLLLF